MNAVYRLFDGVVLSTKIVFAAAFFLFLFLYYSWLTSEGIGGIFLSLAASAAATVFFMPLYVVPIAVVGILAEYLKRA
ncbi:hypothetical protein [Seleniivibrio woodruffii]|uniref:hypothetical protein n=1 Tax=Seleniivibrio woodruffii TaxID=1078050 RepID=UPI00240903FE|nr:hypothetical protein [Seleniivibrio woodruffii]